MIGGYFGTCLVCHFFSFLSKIVRVARPINNGMPRRCCAPDILGLFPSANTLNGSSVVDFFCFGKSELYPQTGP